MWVLYHASTRDRAQQHGSMCCFLMYLRYVDVLLFRSLHPSTAPTSSKLASAFHLAATQFLIYCHYRSPTLFKINLKFTLYFNLFSPFMYFSLPRYQSMLTDKLDRFFSLSICGVAMLRLGCIGHSSYLVSCDMVDEQTRCRGHLWGGSYSSI